MLQDLIEMFKHDLEPVEKAIAILLIFFCIMLTAQLVRWVV